MRVSGVAARTCLLSCLASWDLVMFMRLDGSVEHGPELISLVPIETPNCLVLPSWWPHCLFLTPRDQSVQTWGHLTVFFYGLVLSSLKLYFNYVHKCVDTYGVVNTSVVTMKAEREGQNTWL